MARSCVLIVLSYLVSSSYGKYYECGYHAFDKIFNGEYAAIDEFPWMARLGYVHYNKSFAGYYCGGALISDEFILTAAHCIKNMEEQGLTLKMVRLGEYDVRNETDCVNMMGFVDCSLKPIDVLIKSTKTHEYFRGISNDIGLIKLKQPINYTDFVRPICLPEREYFRNSDKLIVSGWGTTESSDFSSVKLKVYLPVVDFLSCQRLFSGRGIRLSFQKHICAGGDKGKDSCRGDSGAPLMSPHTSSGQWAVVGVTSSGHHCGKDGWPGIYTRVNSYIQWIKDAMLSM